MSEVRRRSWIGQTKKKTIFPGRPGGKRPEGRRSTRKGLTAKWTKKKFPETGGKPKNQLNTAKK